MSIETENEQQPEIFDSLPYYDNDLDVHPILKQKVDAELARESRNNPQTLHPNVPPPIELFSVRVSVFILELNACSDQRVSFL